jgi:hypothetical protein
MVCTHFLLPSAGKAVLCSKSMMGICAWARHPLWIINHTFRFFNIHNLPYGIYTCYIENYFWAWLSHGGCQVNGGRV